MRLGKTEIRTDISAAGCVVTALMCLTLPLSWLIAAVAAAAVHEVSHLTAVYICGGSVPSLCIGGNGAVMESTPMEPRKELFCILAGPAGSFSLLLFSSYFPKTAVCALIQGVYNLLPVYPLDGGSAVKCVVSMLFRETSGRKIIGIIEWVTFIFLCGAGVWGTGVMKLGYLPLLMACLFAFKHLPGKTPCKDGRYRVQYRYHI